MSFDIGLQAQNFYRLWLAGCRKRPGGLRVQSGLSRWCGHRHSGRCFGSGFLRGFLRSGLFRCFLGRRLFLRCRFLRSSLFRYLLGRRLFLRSGFFRSRLFGRYFFRWSLFRSSFLGSWLFSRYFFCWCFFGGHFLGWSLLCRYFFSRRLLCSFFSCWFFRSCHSFLLDHIAKSTSRLEYAKRFTALGTRITGPSAANTGAKPNAHSAVLSLVIAVRKIIVLHSPEYAGQSHDRAPPDWYSITRVSKKLRSFLRSIISLIHGKGFSSLGKRVSSPICVARRLAM